MISKCIVTQVHIPERDKQGAIWAKDKVEMVNVALEHLRKHNQDAYIILTGHGQRPNCNFCDWVYWEDQCRPLDQYGLVTGMPAQFYFVYIGIDHALRKGFDYVMKVRTDGIMGMYNLVDHSYRILLQENRPLLITQQTGEHRMGDCIMFGKTELMWKLWHKDNPTTHICGLRNTANNFKDLYAYPQDCSPQEWHNLLLKTCAFRNLTWFKWMDFRWHMNTWVQNGEWKEIKTQVLNETINYHKYHWGKANGWHQFVDGRDIKRNGFDESRFYGVTQNSP